MEYSGNRKLSRISLNQHEKVTGKMIDSTEFRQDGRILQAKNNSSAKIIAIVHRLCPAD